MSIERFAQRMLNPFHGVVNSITVPGAGAESQDGVHWLLYVEGEPLGDGLPVPDIKYGSWSRAGGLKRAPVPPIPDYRPVETAGHHLLQAVQTHLEEVPFPLVDRLELWLLEAGTDAPLALLTSARDGDPLEELVPPHWRAGQLARAHFRRAGSPQGDESAPSEQVSRLVNTAAGEPARAQWFRRETKQAIGLAGPNIDRNLDGRALPDSAFPPLLVRRRWSDAEATELVGAFLAWQAPYLLQLPNLDPGLRADLERAACSRPGVLAERYRLYPAFVDRDGVMSALVAERLRAAAGDENADQSAPLPLAPFFNE